MRAKTVQRELDCPSQMFIYRRFILVRKWNHFIQERRIAAFRNIFINRREQPQRIICAVCRVSGLTYIAVILRGIFVTRVMGELYQRQTSAMMDLR